MMNGYISKYATATVPRYTSYPPATRFHAGIDEATYKSWLRAIGPEETLSLYVHIPFCTTLCWYCGCHTTVPNCHERVVDYISALEQEIALVAKEVPKSARVVHLHFGGGTPNALKPKTLATLIDFLRSKFSFTDDAELAVEADPRTLTDDHISVIAMTKNARVSLGVQDVSADVQTLINREQPFEVVQSAVARLRLAGIANVNVDLMYGLPGQTVGHVRRSASAVADLGPDRLAVFGYAHVPWFKKNQMAIDETKLPDGEERLRQIEATSDELFRCGYAKIGLDHFAKPGDPLRTAQTEGRLRRNFQGYTVDPASVLIGFGASSIGEFPQGYAQNEPHLGRYKAALAENRLPTARGIETNDEDHQVRAVIERLMCDLAVDLECLGPPSAVSADMTEAAIRALDPLIRDGLVRCDGHKVEATELGSNYIRNIAACFDPHHTTMKGRHSRAI